MFILYIVGVILMIAGLIGVILSVGALGWTGIIVGAALVILAYAIPHMRGPGGPARY